MISRRLIWMPRWLSSGNELRATRLSIQRAAMPIGMPQTSRNGPISERSPFQSSMPAAVPTEKLRR